MLDINKVYVVLHRDNATGHVSGDDPRMKPFLATNAMIEYEHGEPCLAYWAIGDERGHLLEGTIIRQLPNGIVFNARHINETITLTEFTMKEFEQRSRPDMERMTPGVTRNLRTIADVYAFCRRTAHTIHQPEQEEHPMKLTKADIDKVRHIEGFPIARDEDIIALSRPPYYTACPNPFIEDFIRENGTPYDEATDDYHREPFAADVSEGKGDVVYGAHNYHTKVPYKAIMRYILHYTKPGDIVFDGFCGSGMTGVAAQMCENPDSEFRYQLQTEMENSDVRWGSRKVILNDLGVAPCFIAMNQNTPVNVDEFRREAKSVLAHYEEECGWMYDTVHMDDVGRPVLGLDGKPMVGRINYTVWSDVFVCPSCSSEIVFTEASKQNTSNLRDSFCCPHCGSVLKKTDCIRAQETHYDSILQQSVTIAKQVPVLINYTVGKKKYEKKPDENDMEIIRRIDAMDIPYWVPSEELIAGFNTDQPKKSHGITHVHLFYTKRNLYVLSCVMHYASQSSMSSSMRFLYEQVVLGMAKIARYVPTHFSQVNQYLSGTLYIGSQVVEVTPAYIISNKIDSLAKVFSLMSSWKMGNALIQTASMTETGIPDNSIDYVFTDPPFGGNLNYSELNFLWEAWYQEIQPLYLQELHQSKQEKMPELLDMLRENFVQDEKGAWYIPDLNNAADLAKVRRKALLKEFYDSCVPGKGKLKVFRMEAIRAGFDECWKQRDFATIVSVGERLPEAALQEDQTLLMYYDNACSRV